MQDSALSDPACVERRFVIFDGLTAQDETLSENTRQTKISDKYQVEDQDRLASKRTAGDASNDSAAAHTHQQQVEQALTLGYLLWRGLLTECRESLPSPRSVASGLRARTPSPAPAEQSPFL